MRVAMVVMLWGAGAIGAVASGPEVAIKPTSNTSQPSTLGGARTASSGSQFLTVWLQNHAIWGARSAADGSMVDATPLALGGASNDTPWVAGGPDGYLVAWLTPGQPKELLVARIGTSGFLSPASSIATGSLGQAVQVVRFQGKWLVVYFDIGAQSFEGVFITDAGAVSAPVALGTSHTSDPTVSLACSATQCLLSTLGLLQSAPFFVRSYRVDAQLDLIEAGAIEVPYVNGFSELTSASNGEDFLVAWYTGSDGIRSYRINASGVVLDMAPIVVSSPQVVWPKLAVASDGVDFVVAWLEQGQLYGSRIRADGVALEPLGVRLMGEVNPGLSSRTPSIAASAGGYLATMVDHRDCLQSSGCVFGTRVTFSLGVRDPASFGISTNVDRQVLPAVAVSDGGYFAVWAERKANGSFGISGARLAATGAPNLLFEVSGCTGQCTTPAVACAGVACLLVWQDTRSGTSAIYGARADQTGLLDSAGFVIAASDGGAVRPSVSWDGARYVVVWEDWRVDEGDIYSAAVDPDGSVTGVGPLVSGAGRQAWPALASGGGRTLVAWQTGAGDGVSVMYADGGVASRRDLSNMAIANEFNPRVAWGRDDFFVSWLQSSPGSIQSTQGRRLSGPSDAGNFAMAPTTSSSFAWDGWNLIGATAGQGVGGVVVDLFDSGTPTSTFALTASSERQNPVVACASRRQCLVLWESPASANALREIHARAVLDDSAPLASDTTLTIVEDTPITLALNYSDVDDTDLTVTIVQQPVNGVLSGTPPVVTYTPRRDFNGPDSFSFVVHDTWLDSGVASVSIWVEAVNDAPVADDQIIAIPDGDPTELVLTGRDVEGDALTFTITSLPSHGQLIGTAPSVMYLPARNYRGEDQFTFIANDGAALSAPGVITLRVRIPDAGTPEPVDAGSSATPDAGLPVPDPQPNGCGCSTASASWALALLLFFRRKMLK